MTDKIIEILFKHEEPFQDTGLSFVPRWKYKTIAKELLEAINYTPCCEKLPDIYLQELSKVEWINQTQTDLNNQLQILRQFANKLGLYDASDYLKK